MQYKRLVLGRAIKIRARARVGPFPKSRAQASPGLGPFFKCWALGVPKNMGSDPTLQAAEDRIISQLF